MILTRRISLWKLLVFTWPRLLMLAFFVLVACLLAQRVDDSLLRSLSYASGFLGTALAFLIGFRNNTAYNRWWEGHKLWSQIKYESRNLALHITSYVGDCKTQREFMQQIMLFPWLLNQYLRKSTYQNTINGAVDTPDWQRLIAQQCPPQALLTDMAQQVHQLGAGKQLEPIQQVAVTQSLSGLGQALSGCERLKKTPFPMQYNWFMNYTLAVFLLVLPISLAGHIGNWAIPLALVIGYAYIMLEYVGRYIENPFENEVNDVPMDYISRVIEIDLRQMLGETQVPAPIAPRGWGYLY